MYLRPRAIVPVDTETSKRAIRLEERGEELLPGILNDITLELVTPKLSWKYFHVLSSVSPGWQQAIHSHQVYDTRVRSHSTETLAIVIKGENCYGDARAMQQIALYSMSDKTWYELPPIPNVFGGIPHLCGCVSLDGKIYVLGGIVKDGHEDGSTTVYVWDQRGQRQWKQCASMREPRSKFCFLVRDGKIYVLGGCSSDRSEVYDPKVNAWYAVKAVISLRFFYQIGLVKDELFVDDGKLYDLSYQEFTEDEAEGDLIEPMESFDDVSLSDHTKNALLVAAYYPSQLAASLSDSVTLAQWDLTSPLQCYGTVKFVEKGKVHLLSRLGIYVHDKHSWTLLQRCLFTGSGATDSVVVALYDVLAIDDELLLQAHWYHTDGKYYRGFFQSQGFGNKNKEIVWERTKFSRISSKGRFDFGAYALMGSIEL